MKSKHLPDGFPDSPDAWDRLIAAAPAAIDEPECPYDPDDPAAVEAYWRDSVVVTEGGPRAVRAALDARRTRGQRGP